MPPETTKRERQRANRIARREAEAEARKRMARNRALRNVAIIGGALIVAVVGLSFLRSGGDEAEAGIRCSDDEPAGSLFAITYDNPPEMRIDPTHTYEAKVHTSCGEFTIELDPVTAPQSVNSFVALARAGDYDDIPWHRIVSDFVIQTGSPDGSPSGGPGYTLPDEPPPNGYQKGSVALANAGAGTSGSQFFVALSEDAAARLEANSNNAPPYLYSALGAVTSGMDVVEKLGSYGTADGTPTRPLWVRTIEIVERDATGSVVTTTVPTSTTTMTRAG